MSLDRRRRYRLDEYAQEFNRRVEPMDVVDALGPLLPSSAREAIECKLRQDGRISANRELSKRVRSRDGWFEKLIAALIDCGGCDDLVKKLITDKRGSLLPGYENMDAISGGPGGVTGRSSRMKSSPKTSIPNTHQDLEEQATQLSKYNTLVRTRQEALTCTMENQEAETPDNTTLHPEFQRNMAVQGGAKDGDQSSPDMPRFTKISFPNKEQALQEQATQYMKSSTSGPTESHSNPEKGTWENTISHKGVNDVNRRTNDKSQSYQRKEEASQDKGTSEDADLKSGKDCKELMTSLIDEKDKDESGDTVQLDRPVVAHKREPQQMDEKKDTSVMNRQQNQNTELINVEQHVGAASPPHDTPSESQFVEREEEPQTVRELGMRKGPNTLGSCQNSQISQSTGILQEDVHEWSTICMTKESSGQNARVMGSMEKNIGELDPVPNGANSIRGESDDVEKDDDTELRFFRDNRVEQNYFSEASERQKEILKHLDLLTASGARNVAKIKELGIPDDICKNGNCYQPLKSDITSSSDIPSQISESSENDAGGTVLKNEHPHITSATEESSFEIAFGGVASANQGNVGIIVDNKPVLGDGTTGVEDPAARKNKDVDSVRAGHQEIDDDVVNGDSDIVDMSGTSPEAVKDDPTGCQGQVGSMLTKSMAHNGEGNKIKFVHKEPEAHLVLDELDNTEPEASTTNPRHSEVNEVGSVAEEKKKVEGKDVGKVNNKVAFSNDVTLNVHNHNTDREAGDTARNQQEPQDASVLEQGMDIQCQSDEDVNNRREAENSALEKKGEECLNASGETNPEKIKDFGKPDDICKGENSYPLKTDNTSSSDISLQISETSENESLYDYHADAKIEEFGKPDGICKSGNCYKPLKSDITSSSDIPSQTSENDAGVTVIKNEHPHTASATEESSIETFCGEVASANQGDVGIIVDNEPVLGDGTAGVEDPAAGNNEDVESMRAGHQEFEGNVLNGVSNIVDMSGTSREAVRHDPTGCQGQAGSMLTKSMAHNGEGDKTEFVNKEPEAQLVLDELDNTEPEASTTNPRHREVNEVSSVAKEKGKVEENDVGKVNDEVAFSNDVTLNVHNHDTDREAGVTARNQQQLQDASVLEQGMDIQCQSDEDVNNRREAENSALENKDDEEPIMQMSSGLFGRTVSMIGSFAAMVYGSHHT